MIFNLDVVMKNTTVTLDSRYPEDATVTAGQNVTFKAVITDEGHPNGHTLQWYVNGAAVPDATGETYTRSTSSDKGVLSVWCEVTNKAGTTTSRRATLTVNKVPVLNASYPANARIIVAQKTDLAVVIAEDGYPSNYTYQWYVDGVLFPGATSRSFYFNSGGQGAGNKTFYCVVSNSAGSVQSRTATVTISREYLFNKGTFAAGLDFSGAIDDADSYVAFEGDSIHVHANGDGSNTVAQLTGLVDFTGKNKLVFEIPRMSLGSGNYAGTWIFGVADSISVDGIDASFIASISIPGENFEDTRWYAVDVSGIDGLHYVKWYCYRGDGAYYWDDCWVSLICFE